MILNDKRRETSRLNALKSTGPKSPEGKQRSATNALTHGAYAQLIITQGEEPTEFQAIIDHLLDIWKPTNPVEELFVKEMATTLWRLQRQAPAESNLVTIQIQRMSSSLEVEFNEITSHALYALAVDALLSQGTALTQIARQGRRLLGQYEKLIQQLLNLRQMFPPTAPQPADLKPQPIQDPDSIRTEPLTGQESENTPAEIGLAKTKPVETKPVETKLNQFAGIPMLGAQIKFRNPNITQNEAIPQVLVSSATTGQPS